MTGLKHYLGPFEAYAKAKPVTPFREEMPRLPVREFYYTQEDEVFAAAGRQGFSWSVHRPHTIIGYALGNAMNMGVTLAVYATICRETGRPFVFPGSPQQWEGLTDVTDARHPRPAPGMGRDRPRPPGTRRSTSSMATSSAGTGCGRSSRPTSASRRPPTRAHRRRSSRRWRTRGRSGPRSRRSTASPSPTSTSSRSAWHTDLDLGREIEVVTDMTKSRLAGFHDYQDTRDSFLIFSDSCGPSGSFPETGRGRAGAADTRGGGCRRRAMTTCRATTLS